jgi:curved DNA-binding protein CbpA
LYVGLLSGSWGQEHCLSKEIKAAYKRLARLQHPDLNGGLPEATQAFVQLSHARDILMPTTELV